MYEAFGRGDVEAILERVTGDVDWSTDAAIESAPWYGPKHEGRGPQLLRGYQEDRPSHRVHAAEFRQQRRRRRHGVPPLRIHRHRDRQARGDEHAPLLEIPHGKVCFVRSSEDTAQVAAALTP